LVFFYFIFIKLKATVWRRFQNRVRRLLIGGRAGDRLTETETQDRKDKVKVEGGLFLKNTQGQLLGGSAQPHAPSPTPKFSSGAVCGGRGLKRPSFPTQVLSQLSHWSTAHTRKSQGQWRGVGRLGVCTGEEGSRAWEIPLPEGSGSHCTEALACGGTGEGTALPL